MWSLGRAEFCLSLSRTWPSCSQMVFPGLRQNKTTTERVGKKTSDPDQSPTVQAALADQGSGRTWETVGRGTRYNVAGHSIDQLSFHHVCSLWGIAALL